MSDEISVAIRPVNYGYVIDYMEEEYHAEFVALTRQEALAVANSLLADYEMRLDLSDLADQAVGGE